MGSFRPLIFMLLASILLWQVQLAFASSVFQENIPQSFESRSIVLSYDISHSEEQDGRRTIVNLEFMERNSQSPIQFVTIIMNITEIASAETILTPDAFHSENGTISFDITHTDGDALVFAQRENYLNAWVANSTIGTIQMNLPLKPDSTYLIRIGVIGIDSIRGFLPPDQIRSFDVYFNTNEDVAGQASQTIGQVTLEMLEECEGLGIDAESCTEMEIAEKRSIRTTPSISDEQRRLNEERQNQINNSMYMIGIGAAVAGAIAFVTLWRSRNS